MSSVANAARPVPGIPSAAAMLSEEVHDILDAFYSPGRAGDLSEGEAKQIDGALERIKHQDAEAYHLVIRVHRDGKSLRWLEESGEGGRKTNARVLLRAHSFVCGFVQGIDGQKMGNPRS